MTVFDISKNELRRLFLTPLAWTILALVQFIMTVIFLYFLYQIEVNPELAAVNGVSRSVIPNTLLFAGVLFLFISSFLSMRLVSEERRSGTINLLLSSPVTPAEIVLGKYLGLLLFFLLILVMVSLLPLSLAFGTSLDFGLLASGLTGLLLLASSFTAVSLFVSTLTRQPVAAAVITFGLLFFLCIIHVLSAAGNETSSRIINYLSMQRHLANFLLGFLSSIDIIYYLLVSVVFLLLGIIRLDVLRRLD